LRKAYYYWQDQPGSPQRPRLRALRPGEAELPEARTLGHARLATATGSARAAQARRASLTPRHWHDAHAQPRTAALRTDSPTGASPTGRGAQRPLLAEQAASTAPRLAHESGAGRPSGAGSAPRCARLSAEDDPQRRDSHEEMSCADADPTHSAQGATSIKPPLVRETQCSATRRTFVRPRPTAHKPTSGQATSRIAR